MRLNWCHVYFDLMMVKQVTTILCLLYKMHYCNSQPVNYKFIWTIYTTLASNFQKLYFSKSIHIIHGTISSGSLLNIALYWYQITVELSYVDKSAILNLLDEWNTSYQKLATEIIVYFFQLNENWIGEKNCRSQMVFSWWYSIFIHLITTAWARP